MSELQQGKLLKAAKFSLAFLWVFTGLTSMLFSPEVGYQVLAGANITNWLADICVYAGGVLDVVLGLWLLTSIRVKICCIVQIMVIITYTLLLSFINADFWLHPFGPITKNIPIIVLILFVYSAHFK